MAIKYRGGKSFLSLLILSPGIAAYGQTSVPTQETVKDEIIVTATKRSENVLDVPISMQVIDTTSLEALQTSDLSEMSGFVPNMYEPPATEAGRSVIAIRGIGAGVNRSAGRAVGVYVDGVYISAETALDVMLEDIQQVEVLRGPQGTLFGRNTIGGAINISTRTPQTDTTRPAGQIHLSAGHLAHRKMSGHVNIPLRTDRLAVRLSGFRYKRDGYIKNAFDDTLLGGKNRTGLRAQALWTPNGSFKARLNYTWHRIDEQPNSEGEATTNPGSDQIPYTVNLDTPEIWKQSFKQSDLRFDYILPSGFTLTSISAWADVNDFYEQDGDRLPQAITVNRFDGANEEKSQELRLSSPDTAHGNFLLGLYYLDARTLYSPTFPLMGRAFLEQVFFLPPDQHPPDVLDGQRILGQDTTLAVFANGTYDFNDKLGVFGGLRLTRDKKTVDYSIFGETFALFGLPPLHSRQSLTNTPLSWNIGAHYRPSDTLSTYAKISRGYRSATVKDDFIGQADLDAPVGFFTKPEFVTNYEAGLKFVKPESGLRFNTALFYMDYTDIQVSVSQEPFLFLRTLTNAAKAHVWGFEADAGWHLAPDWRLSTGAGYLKTRYDQFMPEPGRDVSGTGFGSAPEWTFNAALDYDHENAHGRWQAHVDARYLIPPHDFVLRTLPFVGEYPLVGAWAGYSPKNGAWRLKLWVKNLTDTHKPKTNFHWGAGLGPLLDNITVQYEMPRRWGLTLDIPFGR